MMNKKRSRKGFLMTVLVVVLFTLMIAELLIFTLLNISYNKIQQSSLLVSSSVNYASSLISSSQAFAAASLSKALSALTSYEYNASMRKGNFVGNLSQYLSYLIVNGTLPNVAPNSLAANALAMWMGNATFKAYNASIINNIKPSPLAVKISESKPIIYQTSPYNLSVSYVENVSIATPSGIQNYSIPVSASIPLNGTYDLFYAQQGVQRPIRFSSINNLTSVVGGAYATYGNSSSNAFIYGIVLHVPSGVTCTSLSSNVPSWANTAPLNKSIILATPNANLITNATCTIANKFGGLVTYSINSISSPPNIPWLQYSSSTNILNYIPNGTKVLLYGPGMDLLNIEGLRNAIQNGSYFASPFLPSYIDRASANFLRSSPNGIFTFSGSNRYAAQFNGQNSYIKTGTNNIPTGSPTVSITAWVNVPIYTASGCGQEMTFGYGNFSSGCNANGVGLGLNGNGYVSFASCGNDYVSPFQVTRNTWTFIAAVYTSGATTVTVYENNNSATGSLSGNKQISIQTPITSWIGAWPSPSCLFDGSIANVQIYNKSLSPSQIQQLYQEGIEGLPLPNAGLVGWWPLNSNANDYSGNGNNGVATNVKFNNLINYTRDSIYIVPTPNTLPIPGTLSCISGKNCNSALYISRLPLEVGPNFYTAQFNGQWSSGPYNSNSVIFAPSEPIAGTNVIFTMAMWIKPSSIQDFSHSWTTATFSLKSYQAFGIQNSCLPNTCLVLHRCTSADASSGALLPYSIFNNKWHFIAVSVNPPNYYWYLDGVSSANTNGNTYTSSPGATIGTQFAQCDSNAFNGSIANVQLYNAALSPSQIQQLYQEGVSGLPYTANLVAWWPLNGNANDYSGLGNNGTAYNVYYTPFYGSYPNNGLSTITGIINEREAFNLVG
ncbi:MAG: LamG domain-containing protein [Candidatus Micrarchaeota archaeon]